MRKKILSIAVIVLCLAIITGGTAAYFTTEDTSRNVITTSGIAIKLEEKQLVGDELMPYPGQPIPVMPGVTVSKIVTAKSLQEPAWVRMSYTVTVYDAQGEKLDVTAEELAKVIIIEADSENWLFHEGFWYYKEAVAKGESTAPLFEQVVFSTTMGNRYQDCKVTVDVTVQAVQQANNGATVLEAAGWSAD